MKLTNSFSRYCGAISCELIGYFKNNNGFESKDLLDANRIALCGDQAALLSA